MKGLLVGFVGLVFLGCITVDNVKEFRNLDWAIDQACYNIQNDFNEMANVAVFDIISPSAQLSEYIVEEVMNSFTNMHKYNVVERSKISSIFQEQDFQMSGNVSDDTIQRIGNILGAQFVIMGSLDDVSNYYRLRLFVISVETGERKSSTAVNIIKPNEQIVYLSGDSVKETVEEEYVEKEKIIKGYVAIVTEIEKLLSDVNSPQTFVIANDMDNNDANGDDGVVFTTIMPYDDASPPEYMFRMIKRSGKWVIENPPTVEFTWEDEYTYEKIIEEVIEAYSFILILHKNKESYIYLWI
ncbi:MAG: penicillin-binding protein activator LpoB [Treponema sp.]|jgi:TolB-like protein|nr:penicillin-binding protein activator LpoB [Treponema sp.]